MATPKFSIRENIAIVAILLVLVMTVLDVTLVNVAVPVMAVKFGISDSAAVWIITIYQLFITMLLLPVSSMGDLFSYKRCFLTGVAIFTISSGLCAASQSFTMIIISRALQGFGAACIMGVNIALTRIIYPRVEFWSGLALNAMVIAIATAAGPSIAGALLSIASWHWLFIINLPIGVVVFILGYRLLPQNPPRDKVRRYDWISAIENVLTFGLIFYALGSFARKGDLHVVALLLIAGIVIGIFYVRRQLHREYPMLPVDLFRIKLYSQSIVTSTCSFIAQNLAMISLPFLFLNLLGFSEIMTGLLMTPWSIATMIVSPLAARFIERHNPAITAACGMGVYAIGVVLMLLVTPGCSHWDIVWRMTICGIGFGLYQTPNNIVMVMATPIKRTGGAGGMQSTARLVGQTLGATFVTLIFAITAPMTVSVRFCLGGAIFFGLAAGALSLLRASGSRRPAA